MSLAVIITCMLRRIFESLPKKQRKQKKKRKNHLLYVNGWWRKKKKNRIPLLVLMVLKF